MCWYKVLCRLSSAFVPCLVVTLFLYVPCARLGLCRGSRAQRPEAHAVGEAEKWLSKPLQQLCHGKGQTLPL